MAIKQILEGKLGHEHRTGGIQVVVKTAKGTIKHGKKLLQQAVLSDLSGDVPADISLPSNAPLTRGQRINIIVCWLQPGENGPKMYVDQWFPTRTDVDGNEIIIDGQKSFPSYGYDDKEDWELRREAAKKEDDRVIRSKCRYGVVCALLSSQPEEKPNQIHEPWRFNEQGKKFINEVVDFIMTGE